MLIYEYFEDINKGLINKKIKKNELRKYSKVIILNFLRKNFIIKEILLDQLELLQSMMIMTICKALKLIQYQFIYYIKISICLLYIKS